MFSTDSIYLSNPFLCEACYMNSAMISLFMTLKFRDTILKLTREQIAQAEGNKLSKVQSMGSQIIHLESPLEELKNLFAKLSNTKDVAIDPSMFRSSLQPRYKNSHHEEDASEFFREYLDLIENPLQKALGKVNIKRLVDKLLTPFLQNFIDECFAGEIANQIECNKCKKGPKKIDKILDLTVNFNPKVLDSKTQKYDLISLIASVFETEIFEGQNKYFCDTCKELSELTTKTSKITKIPEFLIITLNRFYFDVAQNQRSKICDPVIVPDEFDFQEIFIKNSQIRDGNHQYYLYSLIVHIVT